MHDPLELLTVLEYATACNPILAHQRNQKVPESIALDVAMHVVNYVRTFQMGGNEL